MSAITDAEPGLLALLAAVSLVGSFIRPRDLNWVFACGAGFGLCVGLLAMRMGT